MTGSRSLQEWVHWLEVGAGANGIRRCALLLGIALLSILVAFKQFHGPLSEKTFAQILVGRQLAEGKGFTTGVIYPQSVAWLQKRGWKLGGAEPFPELHQPPLYSAVVGGALRVLPPAIRGKLFDAPPVAPDGFGADYVLLVLNIFFLWTAAALTYALARDWFDEAAAMVASLGLLLSVSIWDHTVTLNGTPLMMVLLLVLFRALGHIEERSILGRTSWLGLASGGLTSGLLFLGDYSAGPAGAIVLGYVWFRFSGVVRVKALCLVAAAFLVVVSPWIHRNFRISGNLLGLAEQEIALKAGDSTAEPAIARTTLSTVLPAIDLPKLGNKGLTSIQKTLRERWWSGGGLFLAAFFAVGLFYRFRDGAVNRLRWLFVAMLATLIVSQAFLDSGEGERWPIVYAAPLMMIFGAGFFGVLIASSEILARNVRWVAAGLLFAQGIPLIHDTLQPRGLHFKYPPYYPALFLSLREEMNRRGAEHYAWMADIPAGAAWYSGQRVWAQPATLHDFYAITVQQPIGALVLSPQLLDRPFFSELARNQGVNDRFGDWAQIYSGLLTGRLPPAFPLAVPQRMSENLYVLIDPLLLTKTAK